MIPQIKKAEILQKLNQVPMQTVYALGIKFFLDNVIPKADDDFKRIVNSIKSDIKDGPNHMKEILGDSFNYFNGVQL
jgi:hypothetical protein